MRNQQTVSARACCLLSRITGALYPKPSPRFCPGVEPLVGLQAAFLVGLITSLIGGRPGMISGATGALAVVMVALVASHGVEYLCTGTHGNFPTLAGILGLGKFIRMVLYPVMLGFLTALPLLFSSRNYNNFNL